MASPLLARRYKILYTRGEVPKALFWVGSARQDLRRFPEAARRRAGHQLHLIQLGLMPEDWKPMPAVGSGAYELRVRADGEFRVFYVAKFPEGVYVLHAFAKKTQRTRRSDVAIGQARLRVVNRARREDQQRKER